MGYKDITEGSYSASVMGGRVVNSKSGKTAIEIAFSMDVGAEKVTMLWQGWLSPDAIERTMKTLVTTLGYNGSTAVDEDGRLTDPNAFDSTRRVQLVIEMESYPNADGVETIRPRIKWVNAVSKSPFVGLKPESVKAELGALGFQAAFLAAKGNTKASPKSEAGGIDKDERLPF